MPSKHFNVSSQLRAKKKFRKKIRNTNLFIDKKSTNDDLFYVFSSNFFTQIEKKLKKKENVSERNVQNSSKNIYPWEKV